MKTILFGMGEIGFQTLGALFGSHHEVCAVVTKPQAGAEPSMLAQLCRRCDLPLLMPDIPDAPELLELCAHQDVELVVVAGYHRRIPLRLLEAPPRGVINLHDSLLPSYRGPNSTRWVLINDEKVTGATVHVMTADFDRGPILEQEQVVIEATDDSASLFRKVSRVGARLVLDVLDRLEAGTVIPVAQDEGQASYFSYPTAAEMRLDWRAPGERLQSLVRGLSPAPGAWTTLRGEELRVGHLRLCPERSSAYPGTVVGVRGEELYVTTASRVVAVGGLAWKRLGGDSPGGARYGVPRVGEVFH